MTPPTIFLINPDGTKEPVFTSEANKSADQHEFTVWSDGTLTIEDWRFQYDLDMTRDHVKLTKNQARALRNFLTSAGARLFLDS